VTFADTSQLLHRVEDARPGNRGGTGDGRQISQLSYLPGLDGMRALAVVAVMVYHANSTWLAGGYLGVEVFFVISGYLITLLLIAEHERTGSIRLGNFWLRRFRRLLPALFLMLLLLSVWVALFERDALGQLRGDVLAGIFYGSNWYQIWIGAGYSAGSDFAPLRHLWSLAVEEQFYVVWPLVMFGFVRYGGSRRIAGIARWLFLAAVAVTVVVAFLNHPSAQQSPEFTPSAYWTIGGRSISKPDALYLSTITRSSGLLLGAAFAMIWRPSAVSRGPLRNKGRLFDLGAVLGFAALAAMAWTMSYSPAQGVNGLLFRGGLIFTDVATLAIIAAVTLRSTITGRLLSMPVLLWIGTRSYGLYLYHWPIFQIIRNIAANKLQLHEFILAMVATCIITELSYRFVETPIREGRFGELFKRRRAQPRRQPMTFAQRRVALVGACLSTVLGVFAVTSMATAELKQNENQQSLDEGAAFTCDVLTEDCTEVGAAGGTDAATPADSAADFVPDESGSATPIPGGSTPGAGTDSTSSAPEVVPGTTEPPPPAVAVERLAVGDSVMLGAAKQLGEIGFTVSALESRAFVNGLDYVEQLAEQDLLPKILVIHLGTNSKIAQNEMDRMMAAVADVPQVLLIRNDIPPFPDVEASNNALISATAAQYDNVVELYWDGLAAGCPDPECFQLDGYHLRIPGREYYAALIADTLGI
jgi:peptidoglycan/LPS O-acetylase OafA/YrhL